MWEAEPCPQDKQGGEARRGSCQSCEPGGLGIRCHMGTVRRPQANGAGGQNWALLWHNAGVGQGCTLCERMDLEKIHQHHRMQCRSVPGLWEKQWRFPQNSQHRSLLHRVQVFWWNTKVSVNIYFLENVILAMVIQDGFPKTILLITAVIGKRSKWAKTC